MYFAYEFITFNQHENDDDIVNSIINLNRNIVNLNMDNSNWNTNVSINSKYNRQKRISNCYKYC
jgi:hypothetical protein